MVSVVGSTGVCAGAAAAEDDEDDAAAGEVGRSCVGEPCGDASAWRLVSGEVVVMVSPSKRVRFVIVGVVCNGVDDGDVGLRIGTGACFGDYNRVRERSVDVFGSLGSPVLNSNDGG